jgi:hypothetical protein
MEIHYKSLLDKYINQNERLNDLCLAKFVVHYDTKVNKRHSKNKIIHWVSFNQHKNAKNHYRELLFLFEPLQDLKLNLQNNCDSWRYAYMEQKNDIEKM